jgi:hypothetical protein
MMGLYAGYWAVTVTGLKHGQMWILTRAAMSCHDATGSLKWSDARLAQACRMTVRCLETNIPRLSKLELLKRSDDGFRLVGWLASEKFSEKFSEKEKNQKKKYLDGSNTVDLLRAPEAEIESEEDRARYREAVRRYFERETLK